MYWNMKNALIEVASRYVHLFVLNRRWWLMPKLYGTLLLIIYHYTVTNKWSLFTKVYNYILYIYSVSFRYRDKKFFIEFRKPNPSPIYDGPNVYQQLYLGICCLLLEMIACNVIILTNIWTYDAGPLISYAPKTK